MLKGLYLVENHWLWFLLCLFACQSVASFVEVGADNDVLTTHDRQHHLSESQQMLLDHHVDTILIQPEHQNHDEHHVHLCHHHHGEHNPPVLLNPIKWQHGTEGLSTYKHSQDALLHRFVAPLLRPPIIT